MDRLAHLLEQFALRARVFHSGLICGSELFDSADGSGHLHVLRAGVIELQDSRGDCLQRLDRPSLAFYPRPLAHRLATLPGESAELVCASVSFGQSGADPLSAALPNPLVLALDEAPALAGLLQLLFDEAFAQRCGRSAALDRLSELLVLHLLRIAMSSGGPRMGVLAGLADPRLAKALVAMHAQPAEAWTLQRLAERAGMSRARFALHFQQVVGQTPMDYLAGWRMGLAMAELRRGRPVGQVAQQVGYGSASALARVFSARVGVSPLAWLRAETLAAADA
ncbi:AraC family transcriptional regulator [uncultured Aquimonas sp.]|uniref:AraC family transcriptional regulator n=1 Tax=uncultured Aquimonas sp. TaxID=385483 RepID=UPI00086EC385|nr:AraC family transcriptional regulator [uncultured Aquimonas sp.]ODU48291.1 MAG: AraC family transcriptional regulator [Xanthomonadaceae bacterium SCN 69-123]